MGEVTIEEVMGNMIAQNNIITNDLPDVLANKSAAFRVRKATLALDKLGKVFRKMSVAYHK